MPRISSGLLMYRRRPEGVQVLLVHPGGPFWKNKDDGAWSIPKGEVCEGEDLLVCAKREFQEETGVEPIGKVVIGTVKGDIHDIGKNLVAMMLEGAGFEVHDLGVNTDADTFIAAVQERRADILGMSALLTTTMSYMKVVIDEMKRALASARGQGA